MRKILLMILTLFMIFCSTSFAYEGPDTNRWLLITSNETSKYWLDTETIRYSINNNNYSDCYKHRMVHLWTMSYVSTDKKTPYFKSYMQWDLDCCTMTTKSLSVFNKKFKLINTYDYPNGTPKPIPPETIAEWIYKYLLRSWELNYK